MADSVKVNTGAGDEELPVYGKDEVQFLTGEGYAPEGEWGYAGSRTGLWGFQNPHNFRIMSGDANGFTAYLKSGDKEGTQVRYTLQGDKWVPQVAGKVEWNTNPTERNMGLLKAAAVMAAVAGGAFALSAVTGGASSAAAAGAGSGAAGGATGATGADLASAYGASALGGEAGAVTAPATAWGTTGAGYVPGTAATAGFTPGSGVIAGEASGAMAAAAPAVTKAAPTLLDRLVDAYNSTPSKAVRTALEVANGLQSGAAVEPVDGGVGAQATSANPANVQVGGVNLGGLPTGTGGRKPGAVAVPDHNPYALRAPEAPEAPGVINSQFRF